MDNGLIPYRYAKALYKYGVETDSTKQLYDLVNKVIKAFSENPSMQKILANPFVKESDKESILLTAAGDLADDPYKRFIKLIIEHKRVDYAYGMMLAYRDIYRKENHISQVKIITASQLNSEQMQQLKSLVEKSFSGSSFEFSEEIDPDLIGGFIIDVDNVRMDASINNELEQLRQTLLRS